MLGRDSCTSQKSMSTLDYVIIIACAIINTRFINQIGVYRLRRLYKKYKHITRIHLLY